MRIVKIVFLSIVITLSLGLSTSVEAATQEEVVFNRGGGTSDVIQNPSIHNLGDVIEEKYAGKDDLVVYQVPVYERYERGNLVVKYEHNVPIQNIEQQDMNVKYRQGHGYTISGTCTPVAITMLTHYYGEDSGEYDIYNRTVDFTHHYYQLPQQYEIGNELWQVFGANFQMGRAQDYLWSDSSGTFNTHHRAYINYTQNAFGSANSASTSLRVYQTIQDETSEGRPVMFNIYRHTMVARGYVRFRVAYTETTGWGWWKETVRVVETVDYIIVNHGWKETSYNEYGYFPASKTTSWNPLYNAQRINEAN